MIACLTHRRVQLCFWIAPVCAAQLALSSPIQTTPDSMYYFDIARNIATGKGISSEIHQIGSRRVPDYLSYWPPLYPAGLALPLMLGLDFPGAALAVNALSLALLGSSARERCGTCG